MGTWGAAAWDNDSAADWFADMFEDTKLADHVVKTLMGDPEEEPEEIRAAAYMLVALGRTYIWPVDQLDEHLALAIEKLEAIKALYEEEDEEIVAAIEAELAQLRSEVTPEKPPEE